MSDLIARGMASKNAASLADIVTKTGYYVTPEHFGAVGDGVADDTTAYQSALDYADTNNLVVLNLKRYKITSTLKVGTTLKIKGFNKKKDSYDSTQPITSSLDFYCPIAFQPKSITNGFGKCCVTIEGVFIQNIGSLWTTSILFDQMNIAGGNIFNNGMFQWGTVIHGQLTFCSNFHHNIVEAVYNNFIYCGDLGAGTTPTIVDSFIHHNYINGKPEGNATCFNLYYPAMSFIEHNYIDFFKYAVNLPHIGQLTNITDNNIDYCYCGFYGQLSAINISRNHFRYCQQSQKTQFPNADSDMNTNPWTGIWATNNAYQTTIKDNLVLSCDRWMYMSGTWNIQEFTSRGNNLYSVTTPITYNATKSGVSGDQNNIYIEELDRQTFTTLPSATLTGSSILTFNHQEAYYNNKKIYNNNGTWNDMLGNVVS